MGANDKSYAEDVRVKCSNCGHEYTATVFVHEKYSDEGFIGQHEDPPSGLCPECGDYRKEVL